MSSLAVEPEEPFLKVPEVKGKRFVPMLLIGFIVFAAIMTYGTYFLGRALTPYFKHRQETQKGVQLPPPPPDTR